MELNYQSDTKFETSRWGRENDTHGHRGENTKVEMAKGDNIAQETTRNKKGP